MHKGIFITGTDTGVGKTFVAAGLLRAFKEREFNICPMKPVETGCRMRDSRLIPADTLKLVSASGVKEPLDVINPYRFRHPLAPSVAAEIEGRVIKKQKIISAFRRLLNKYDFIIAEGAGGIMVPVYKEYLFIDLIKDLALPLIIVSRPGLGTINHTLLTIKAAERNGIEVLGIVINYAVNTKKGLSEKTNPAVIEALGNVPILGIVPYAINSSPRIKKVFLEIARRILFDKVF